MFNFHTRPIRLVEEQEISSQQIKGNQASRANYHRFSAFQLECTLKKKP
jgi:hypothetical protein